ncbi:MAG TPA: DUF4412 domain-containing protein [Cyclobacteriaceae bacterium]|nr:DUF4412 domain-containing protein [Cyclobacteriaceae bacterium]
MRRLLPVLLVLLTSAVYAQSFEGTLKWTFFIETTNPTTPQYIDLVKNLPGAIEVKIKGRNTLTTIEGEPFNGNQILYVADGDVIYYILHDSKTYVRMPQNTASKKPVRTVTKTDESGKVDGYNCTKYIVMQRAAKEFTTMFYYVTDEIKGLDLNGLETRHMGQGTSFIIAETGGIPVKVSQTLPEGELTIRLTGTKKESLPGSLFEIPEGYTERKL